MTGRVGSDEVAAELARRLPGRVATGASSVALTTYRCGGPIAVLVRAGSEADVREVAAVLSGREDMEVLVVGRGSNLLVADSGFAGVGLLLAGELERVDIDPATGLVTAGAATPLPVLARRTAAAGRSGLEFFVGIPGSVGGAVRMNAGGHGRETRDVLEHARVMTLTGGEARVRTVADLALGYRTSAIDERTVVVEATFRTTADDPVACEERVAEIVRWRRENQPGGQNAGSVFKNPPGDSAGRLIDATGCKGLRVGGVTVSEKHANFFVAEPGARAADVLALLTDVQQRVRDATGIHLEPELHLVGFEVPSR